MKIMRRTKAPSRPRVFVDGAAAALLLLVLCRCAAQDSSSDDCCLSSEGDELEGCRNCSQPEVDTDLAYKDSNETEDSQISTSQIYVNRTRLSRVDSQQETEIDPSSKDNNETQESQASTSRIYVDRFRRKHAWINELLRRLLEVRYSTTLSSASVGGHSFGQPTDSQSLDAFLVHVQHSSTSAIREELDHKKYRIFLPQCSGPRHFTGSWNDGMNFRLFFDVESAEVQRPRETRILSAFLHLRKKPLAPIPDSTTRASPTTDGGRSPRSTGPEGGTARGGNRRRSPATRSPMDGTFAAAETGSLKLMVYAYGRPNRRNKPESRTVVRTMVMQRSVSGLIRLNLKPVVEEWMKKPQKNFGLQITVRDEIGNEDIDPTRVFEEFNCNVNQSNAFLLHLSLSGIEELLSQSPSWSTADSITYMNTTNSTFPYLELLTEVVARPTRIRNRRDTIRQLRAPAASRVAAGPGAAGGLSEEPKSTSLSGCVLDEILVQLDGLSEKSTFNSTMAIMYSRCQGSCHSDVPDTNSFSPGSNYNEISGWFQSEKERPKLPASICRPTKFRSDPVVQYLIDKAKEADEDWARSAFHLKFGGAFPTECGCSLELGR